MSFNYAHYSQVQGNSEEVILSLVSLLLQFVVHVSRLKLDYHGHYK